jgi:hypothetical protein
MAHICAHRYVVKGEGAEPVFFDDIDIVKTVRKRTFEGDKYIVHLKGLEALPVALAYKTLCIVHRADNFVEFEIPTGCGHKNCSCKSLSCKVEI